MRAARRTRAVLPAVLGEGVVPRQAGVRVPVQQELVDGLLRDAGKLGFCLYHLPERVEAAAPRRPAVVEVAARSPVFGHGLAAHPVPAADLAEVGLGAGLPVHAQLAHNVPFHIVLLSKGHSRGGYLRWRGWAKCVGAVGTSILVLLDFYVGVTGPFYIGINSLKRKLSSSQGCCQTS